MSSHIPDLSSVGNVVGFAGAAFKAIHELYLNPSRHLRDRGEGTSALEAAARKRRRSARATGIAFAILSFSFSILLVGDLMQNSDKDIATLHAEMEAVDTRLDGLELRVGRLEQRFPPTGPSPMPSDLDDRFDQFQDEVNEQLHGLRDEMLHELERTTDTLARLEEEVARIQHRSNESQHSLSINGVGVMAAESSPPKAHAPELGVIEQEEEGLEVEYLREGDGEP